MNRANACSLIRDYYAAFNARDFPAMLAMLDENVLHDINQGGTEVGREAFARFLERMDRCYREQVTDLEVLANELGDRASAEFYVNGTYLEADEGLPPAHGQTYRLRVGAFFEISGEQIRRVTNYYNLPDWLRMVGGPG